MEIILILVLDSLFILYFLFKKFKYIKNHQIMIQKAQSVGLSQMGRIQKLMMDNVPVESRILILTEIKFSFFFSLLLWILCNKLFYLIHDFFSV